MAWRVLLTDAVDLSEIEDPEDALSEVFDWAVKGPPCNRLRGVGPAVLYDDVLENGIRVQYFIGTYPYAYVADRAGPTTSDQATVVARRLTSGA